MKKTFLWIALVALCTQLGAQEKKAVRLLYWNIQNGMWSDQPNNYDNFVNFVKEQHPDICVWCEAASIYYNHTATGYKSKDEAYLPSNWDTLAERYGHPFVYLAGWRDNYPQVITSKFPIRNVKRILGNGDSLIVVHGAGWAQIEIEGNVLNLVTLHTWPQAYAYMAKDVEQSKAEHGGDKYRAVEMQYICESTILTVPQVADELWMMMGDFNSPSRVDSAHYTYEADSPRYLVHDYIRANTPYRDVIYDRYGNDFQTSTGGQYRIDFVYATPCMEECITFARIYKSEGWLNVVRDPQKLSNFYHPSDHLPIVVDFELQPKK